MRNESIWTRNRVSVLLVALFSLIYFAQVIILCSEKYLWYDEFFTLYVCKLPNLRVIWHALKHGVDFNPPLFYAVTSLSKTIFGENRYALRFPAIVGFWVFCVTLFWFVRRRMNAAAGFAAMVFPTLTGAMYYAYEARPYGMLLGFCGLALVCWQAAIDGVRRRWWLLGLGLSLSGALMMHCYAVLLVFPFALAEIFRTVSSRRFDLGIWTALVLPPLASCLIYIPMLVSFGSLAQGTNFSKLAPPTWDQIPTFYLFLLSPCLLVVVAVVVALGFGAAMRSRRTSGLYSEAERGPVLELILASSFLLLPLMEVLLLRQSHSSFLTR